MQNIIVNKFNNDYQNFLLKIAQLYEKYYFAYLFLKE